MCKVDYAGVLCLDLNAILILTLFYLIVDELYGLFVIVVIVYLFHGFYVCFGFCLQN